MATNSTSPLYDYGIQNEQSDIRAHVCPAVHRVYVFSTAEGCRAVESGRWIKRPAFQAGVKSATAEGYCIPPFAIKGCVAVEVWAEAWQRMNFQDADSLPVKGRKAVYMVSEMIRHGLFPLPCLIGRLNANPEKRLQIAGDDIIVNLKDSCVRIQVKCDYRGGDKTLGGTGNLYLQVAECNPLKRI